MVEAVGCGMPAITQRISGPNFGRVVTELHIHRSIVCICSCLDSGVYVAFSYQILAPITMVILPRYVSKAAISKASLQADVVYRALDNSKTYKFRFNMTVDTKLPYSLSKAMCRHFLYSDTQTRNFLKGKMDDWQMIIRYSSSIAAVLLTGMSPSLQILLTLISTSTHPCHQHPT